MTQSAPSSTEVRNRSLPMDPLLSRRCFAAALLSIGLASRAVSAPAAAPAADPHRGRFAIPTRADQAGRIVALVSIDGRGPFRFMLDTGSNRTVLAQSVLPRIGRSADPGASIAVTGINGSEQAPSVDIDRLDAGEIHFSRVRLPVLSGPIMRGLDGILGMDGFSGMKLYADFTGNKVNISVSRGKRAPVVYSVIPVQLVSGLLLMATATADGIAVKAIIDTGSPRTLGNPALLAALSARHRHNTKALRLRVIDATQTSETSATGTIPSFRIGSVTVDDLQILFGPFRIFRTWGIQHEPAVLIGMDVLGTLDKLSIDYRRREVALLTNDDPPLIQRRWFSLTH